MTTLALAPEPTYTTQTEAERAEVYRQAVRDERKAETNSIIAAWDAGHTFRTYDDPVYMISKIAGIGEQYIRQRIRLAGAFTRAQLLTAIDNSGCTHFTAFYSWAFQTKTHETNQKFPRRNVHLPQQHSEYFEKIDVDVTAMMKDFLAAISPSELHALLKRYVPE